MFKIQTSTVAKHVSEYFARLKATNVITIAAEKTDLRTSVTTFNLNPFAF